MRIPAIVLALGALLLPACAHAQGAALLQKPITAGNCATLGSPNLVADSGVGCSGHQVTIADGVHGSMVLAPTTILLPNSPAILNNTSAQPLLFIKGVASTGADGVDFDFRRIASYTGGTFGFVNATLRTFTTVAAGTNSFEWPMLCVLENSASLADNSQNSCGYFQAHKRNGGGTWALTAELLDHNADPVSPSVTFEHDLQVKGTDVHAARVIDDLWGKSDDGNAAVISNAFRLNTDAHTILTNGVTTQGATISNAAFAMGTGQKFCLDGITCANAISQTGGAISLTAPGGVLTGPLLASNLATTGNINLTGGNKFCLDGTTCANYLTQSGGTVSLFAGGASQLNLTSTHANLGSANALSLTSTGAISGTTVTGSGAVQGATLASTGDAAVPSGNKICLNGLSPCSTYITMSGTQISFFIAGTIVMSIDSTGFLNVTGKYGVNTTPGVNCTAGAHQTLGGITVIC